MRWNRKKTQKHEIYFKTWAFFIGEWAELNENCLHLSCFKYFSRGRKKQSLHISKLSNASVRAEFFLEKVHCVAMHRKKTFFLTRLNKKMHIGRNWVTGIPDSHLLLMLSHYVNLKWKNCWNKYVNWYS